MFSRVVRHTLTFLPRFGALAAACSLTAGLSEAQEEGLAFRTSGTVLDWILLLGVFLVIWLLLYKGLYPLFLRHYRPDYCKFLFWSLFLLYALAWLHLSLYVLFDIGFYYEWARWTAVFLSVLWLIWFSVVFLRRPV